jgi:hypothetical protein
LDPPTLEKRIETLHEETDAVIATHISEITKETPRVPTGVIEQTTIDRARGCRCARWIILGQPIDV